jgi:predicted restriction endonuclease
MGSPYSIDYAVMDIMHIVNKSQGGLGIEENGVLGCRYHHGLLDNGSKGLREDMLEIIEEYMKKLHPDWNREDLIYKK